MLLLIYTLIISIKFYENLTRTGKTTNLDRPMAPYMPPFSLSLSLSLSNFLYYCENLLSLTDTHFLKSFVEV